MCVKKKLETAYFSFSPWFKDMFLNICASKFLTVFFFRFLEKVIAEAEELIYLLKKSHVYYSHNISYLIIFPALAE